MLVDSRAVARTQSFYDWELRGRGWSTYPHPVVLEPAFRAFGGHGSAPSASVDDARRHTWLSSLIEEFRGRGSKEQKQAEPQDEPVPEEDPRSEADLQLEEFVISLPEDARVSRAAILGWLRSLSTASGPISFELLGWDGRVELRLSMAQPDAPHVLRQLRAAAPPATVIAAEETLPELWEMAPGERFAAVEFGLASEFMIPFATFSEADEPLLPLLAALADVDSAELGLVQVLFEETRNPWAESVLRSVVTPGGLPFFADAQEMTKLAQVKVSSPLFAVGVRIAGVARDGDGAWDIVRRVASGLSQFGNPASNELMPLAPDDLQVLERDLLERTTHRSGMLLSTEELVSLVHLPGPGVQIPELWRSRRRTRRAPEEVTGGAGCLLGANEHDREIAEVRLPVDTKTKHVHVVGASGTGKSTLLLRMILEDIEAGHGVGVLDPHGDLVNEVASRIPDHRLNEVVLFDPADDETVVGWNILGAQSEVEKDLLASDLVSVFRRLSTSWGDQMTAVLANAILVFLESERGGTLEELRQFLLDEDFRKEMLATVGDPHIASFWESEFPLIAGRRPQAPILTRLDMFLRSKLVRRVVTVKEPKLDFRKVTDDGHIFLGNLAMGVIGEENAALLGSLIVSRFHQVTLARAGQAIEDRRPFFLYVDEFHHVATASMASLFSGVRKYRLGLTVAHHDLHQLHQSVPEVERSLLANAYTRICFRVGDEDARQLAKGFSYFDSDDLMELELGEALCRVGGRRADFNLRTEKLPEIGAEEAKRRRDAIRELSGRRWGTPVGEESRAPTAARLETPDEEPPPAQPIEKPERRVAIGDSDGVLSRPEEPEEAKDSAQPLLDKATLDYLEHLAEEPFLSLTDRHAELGLGIWKGNEIKKDLVGTDLVREVVVHPGGRGQRFVLLEFTGAGREVLSMYGIRSPRGYGRGGIAHQWWAMTISKWLAERGVSSEIENESQGARVDLSFSSGTKGIAVEIEMTEGHAVENIRKDLEAGFDLVISLVDASVSTESLEEEFTDFRNAVPPKVLIGLLQEYEDLLQSHLRPHPPPLRDPRQKEKGKEPRRRRRRKTPASAESGPDLDFLSKPGALLTPAAAQYVGLSPSSMETRRSRGGGPSFSKIGQRVVYRREDLDAWLAEHQKKHTNED